MNKEMMARHKQHVKRDLYGLFTASMIILYVLGILGVTAWIF